MPLKLPDLGGIFLLRANLDIGPIEVYAIALLSCVHRRHKSVSNLCRGDADGCDHANQERVVLEKLFV